jgi:hypothetical protein
MLTCIGLYRTQFTKVFQWYFHPTLLKKKSHKPDRVKKWEQTELAKDREALD